MDRYTGPRESFRLPDVVHSQIKMAALLDVTRKVIEQVELENHVSRLAHTSFQNFSEDIEKTCLSSESKLNSEVGGNTFLCKEVIKMIYIIFRHCEQQAFKNQISLKTLLKTEKDSSLFKAIQDKLHKARQRAEEYQRLFEEYEQMENLYVEKSQKFANITSNTIKYYEIDRYNKKLGKILETELEIQKVLEKLKAEQAVIQVLFKETRKLLEELFVTKIKRIYEIIRFVREVILKMLVSEDVIVEEGSKDYLTNISDYIEDENKDKVSSPEQAFEMVRNILKKERPTRDLFEEYIDQLIKSLEHRKQLLASGENMAGVNREKRLIENSLGPHLYYDQIDSQHEVGLFCRLLQNILVRLKEHKTIATYKKMEEDLMDRLTKEVKSFSNQLPNKVSTKQDLQKHWMQMRVYLKKKYTIQAQHINTRFKQNISLLIKLFRELMDGFPQEIAERQLKPDQKKVETQVKKIFMSECFKVFSVPFTTQSLEYQFVRSQHITFFLKMKTGEDQMENLSANLDVDRREFKDKILEKALCCGSMGDDEIINEYNCALVNKILLQGKLFLYRREIKFVSFFNRATLFGKTKLRIPARDILNVDKDKALVNAIQIQTKHGTLRFSSFLTNPLHEMRHHYPGANQASRSQFKHTRSQSKHILSPQKHSIDHPLLYNLATIKTKIVSRLIQMGYLERTSDQMFKTYLKNTSRIMQTVRLNWLSDCIVIEIDYSIEGQDNEVYKFNIRKEVDNSLDVEYQLSGNKIKFFKESFMALMRALMDKDQIHLHNTSSQIFEMSSIDSDKSSKYIDLLTSKQFQSAPVLPRVGVTFDESATNKSESKILPKVYTNSFIGVKPLDKSVLVSQILGSPLKPSKVTPQQPQQLNPVVMYILLGIVVLVLVIII